MDGIQSLWSKAKANPAAAAATGVGPANDDETAANAFAALLNNLGTRFKPSDTSSAMDTKLLRNDDAAQARAADARDTVKKAREEKSDDRAAAKPKATKARTNDDDSDSKTADDTKASDASDDTQTNADTTQTNDGEAAAQVAAAVAVDVPLVATETVAPVLIAQQVQAVVDPAATQQAAVQTTAAATETAAVDTKAVVADAAATQQAAVVEAPAAVEKAAVATGPTFKQAVAETAGPAQNTVNTETATTTQTTKAETAVTKTADTTQATVNTERSTVAQAQSQDLSQKVGPDTKAQVQVNVTTHVAQQAAATTNVYDIYAGYNGTQTSTANGQVGDADAGNALVGGKTSADMVQAQAAATASPAAVTPQPQSSATQQSTPSASAARADVAIPAPTQSSNAGNQTSFGDTAFGGASTGSNTQQANSTTASTPTTATERPMATAQQIIDQIKVNITRAAKAGLDKVTIQLKPIELGRIDVKLEMSEDHKVRVEVTADNKDTLALLQNDSRTLERTLNEAGLRTDAGNLHFSLRSDSDTQTAQDGRNGSAKNGTAENAGATNDNEDVAMTFDYQAAALARGGVDTFA